MRSKRKPASIQCPFCEVSVSSWFLRERLDLLGWHIQDNHPHVVCAICHGVNKPSSIARHLAEGCFNGFGNNFRWNDSKKIIAAWHAQLLGITTGTAK